MANLKVASIVPNMTRYIYNPEALADIALDTLLEAGNVDDTVELYDPSDPVVRTIEMGALMVHAAVEHDWYCMTKTYPRLAVTMGDLYRHMSDKDYPDLFTQPADTRLLLLLNKEEIFKHAVPPNGLNVRRIVIPRDSSITVDGYTFTMQYPIEIRVLPSGGIQVIQVSDTPSPLRVLDTNNIDWSYTTKEVDGKAYECVAIYIPVMQYQVVSSTYPIVAGTTFKQTLSFSNAYYVTRVWARSNSAWRELKTTHSQIVFDPKDPTAVITMTEGQVTVKIPDLYVRTGLLSGEIRIEVHSTMGVIDLDVTGHSSDAFKMKLDDRNDETDSTLVAPFERLSFKQVYSPERIIGGRAALSLEQMRDRVVDNAIGPKRNPISERQLQLRLEDMGYTLDKSIDFVTDRIYHASRILLESPVKELSTPCGTTNGIVRTQFSELVKQPSVYDNGQRITIGPSTLYSDSSNEYVVHDKTVEDVLAIPPLQRIEYMNENRLFFSPFYYVLDSNSDVFETRPYELDTPVLTSKEFVETNIQLELDIAIGDVMIAKHPEGYLLRIITRSSDVVKKMKDEQLEVQIAFKSRSSDTWSRLNATLVGWWGDESPERVYDAVIRSNMDVDKNHDLIVNNFIVNGDQTADQAMQLNCELNVVFGVNNYTTPGYKSGAIDRILNGATDTSKGVTHERLYVTLGHHLSTLWANGRSETGAANYLKHEVDVYAKYDKREYKRNADGTFATETVDGVERLVVEHEIGDYRLDPKGNRIIQFHAGTPVMVDGEPVISNPRKIVRRLEVFLLDGRYAACDSPDVRAYMAELKRDLLKSILFDLPNLKSSMLEKTDIFVYPRNNMGKVWVRYADNTRNQISAELPFLFSISVDEQTRTDPVLTEKIKETIRARVNAILGETTVSVSRILEDIRGKISDIVVDIELEAFGKDKDQKVYALINPKDQLTMGKLAYVTQEGYVSLRDDLRMSWGRLDEELKK